MIKDKYFLVFEEGSKITQIICCFLINLPVFAYGSAVGWMSPMTLLLQSENSTRSVPLTDIEISWIAAVSYLVSIPVAWLLAVVADKIGRKYTLLMMSLSMVISWILLLFSVETWALVTARALVGVIMAGSYVICPIYIKEIADDNIRGSLGCWIVISHTTGNLFLYIIGDTLPFRTITWICLSVPLAHLLLFTMMPDTPSYLVKIGKEEKALKILAWLRCKSVDNSDVVKELGHIKKEQENDATSNKFLLKSIYKDKILFRAFRIALFTVIAREACGAIPVTNFAGEIFTNASGESRLILTPNQQAMLLGFVQVIGSTVASSVPLLITTSLISGLSMGALATWFLLRIYGINATSWIPIVTLCVCIFCDAAGLLPVSMILGGEIFSFKYRGTVMAVTMSIAAFSAFLQLLFFKPIAIYLGIYVAFYLFAIVCLFITTYVIIAVPETKGRCLQDIYSDLRKKNETIELKDKVDDTP
ncbi:unnamed protein product [Leptidea sinapis]|uniref:Major facilitator superfamily (MFS) profile domain-containing protein n=1 Tax=Leptidea sinapis TaxID=189913 RepID=A0A5E4QNN4_9NEOP|nr:unnamed protein product [Leptidea sinapis]